LPMFGRRREARVRDLTNGDSIWEIGHSLSSATFVGLLEVLQKLRGSLQIH
jgi:hypothetical protein